MAIAISVQQYLSSNGVQYDSIEHRRTGSSSESARVSFVSPDSLAKGVVLRNREGYLLTVLPSSQQADLDKVGDMLNQPVALALEDEIASLFPDCEHGAVPPVGSAYGMQTIVDKSLDDMDEVYFEAGDHRTLVHLSAAEFHKLMLQSTHGRICADPRTDSSEMGFGYFGA